VDEQRRSGSGGPQQSASPSSSLGFFGRQTARFGLCSATRAFDHYHYGFNYDRIRASVSSPCERARGFVGQGRDPALLIPTDSKSTTISSRGGCRKTRFPRRGVTYRLDYLLYWSPRAFLRQSSALRRTRLGRCGHPDAPPKGVRKFVSISWASRSRTDAGPTSSSRKIGDHLSRGSFSVGCYRIVEEVWSVPVPFVKQDVTLKTIPRTSTMASCKAEEMRRVHFNALQLVGELHYSSKSRFAVGS